MSHVFRIVRIQMVAVPVVLLAVWLMAFPVSAGQKEDALEAFKRRDFAVALPLLEPLAEQGDTAAAAALGWLYETGKGTQADAATALRWYRQAAEQGHAGGQNSLGNLYYLGLGTEQNHTEAAKWYRKAADQGVADAQFNLGLMYEYGLGVGKSTPTAAEWYAQAAEQGLSKAYFQWGSLLYYADGVSRETVKGVRMIERAARSGAVNAIAFLGAIHFDGSAPNADPKQAWAYLNLANRLGNGQAGILMGILERELPPSDTRQARRLQEKWMAENGITPPPLLESVP